MSSSRTKNLNFFHQTGFKFTFSTMKCIVCETNFANYAQKYYPVLSLAVVLRNVSGKVLSVVFLYTSLGLRFLQNTVDKLSYLAPK